MYRGAQCAGAFAMDDTDGRQMRDIGVIQILVEHSDRLVCRHADQIDLGGDGRGFRHTDLSRTRFAVCLFCCRRYGIVREQYQISHIDQRAQNAHLHIEIAPCVWQGVDGSGQIHAEYLDTVTDAQILWRVSGRSLLFLCARHVLFRSGHFITDLRALFFHLADRRMGSAVFVEIADGSVSDVFCFF